MKSHHSSVAVFATSCVLAASGAVAFALRRAQRLKALDAEHKRQDQAARIIQDAWRDSHPQDHHQKAIMHQLMLRWKRAIEAQRDRTAAQINAVLKANWDIARKEIRDHIIFLIQASWNAEQQRREEFAMHTIQKLFLPAVYRWKLLREQEHEVQTDKEAAPMKHVSFDILNDADDDSSMNSRDLPLSTPMEKALFSDHAHQPLSFKHIFALIFLAMAVAFALIQQNGSSIPLVQTNVVDTVKKTETNAVLKETLEVSKDSKDITWQALPLFFGAK